MFPNPFHRVPAPWGKLKLEHDKDGLIILDGRQIRLKTLATSVAGRVAYVGGITEKSFPQFCALVAAERMDFFEMRVNDISPLAGVRNLRHLAIRWNRKLRNSAPLAKLKLRTLILEDTPKVRNLEPVGRIRSLEYFEFAGGMSGKNIANTLAPLSRLPKLTHISLANLRVEQDGLIPLAKCKRLKKLQLPNQFTTEEYAYLSVKLPKTRCGLFSAWESCKNCVPRKDVMVVGIRKPWLNSKIDRKKIRRYERDFAQLRARFASNKALQPTVRSVRFN